MESNNWNVQKSQQVVKTAYAERMAKRLQLMGIEKYKDGFL